MESNFLVNIIGLSGAFFVGLILFWFIFVYFKKRMTSDRSNRGSSAATKISWEEKRQHPRLAISWQASLENSERALAVHLKDISLGGGFVICQEPLALQDQFKITIKLPNQDPLPLNAEVVWSNVNMPRDKVVNRGMGIRFINNADKERQQLQDAISAAFDKTDESVEEKQ